MSVRVCHTPRPRKRHFESVDVVEELPAKAEKKSSCPFCKVQEGDIDQCQPATAELGPRRIRLRDGMDDYCYVLIVLQYGHLSAKVARLSHIFRSFIASQCSSSVERDHASQLRSLIIDMCCPCVCAVACACVFFAGACSVLNEH